MREKIGGFSEVVVYDRPTRSLLVTDLVVAVSDAPPDIIAENDVRALLYHARDGPAEQAQRVHTVQPLAHTVAASITYGCSLGYLRLQPPSHTAAASGTYRCSLGHLASVPPAIAHASSPASSVPPPYRAVLQVADTAESRRVGWQKICLFACYFQSSTLDVAAEPDGTLAGSVSFFRAAFPPEVPAAVRALGWKGFIAWRWQASWPETFAALRYGGRPFVPPILQELVLNRKPAAVLAFAEGVAADFAFTHIIPAHFDAMVPATPKTWLDAFRPFGSTDAAYSYAGALPEADLAFLRAFEDTLVRGGTIRPRVRPRAALGAAGPVAGAAGPAVAQAVEEVRAG